MPSAALAAIQSTDTLLDYSLTTSPSPLQVSASATTPSIGTITIVVSNHGPDVTLTSIEIDLPVGDPTAPEGADLTEVGAGIGISVSDSAWQATYPGKTDGVLFVKPVGGTPIVIGDQGIAITITNIQVSTEPGTALVTIVETATTSKSPAKATAVLAVPKFPLGFTAGGFSITTPVIANGGTSTMTWYGTQGTGITYTILWSGAPADVSKVHTWTSPPLTDVTTFILQVVATTPNGPVHLAFPATQVVSDPSIVAQTLDVLGPTTLTGDVTTGPPGNLIVQGNVTASGTAQAGTVAATSSLTSPAATISGLHAGTVNVGTSAVFAAGSTISGAVNAMGASIASFANAVTVNPGTSTFNTDGFLIGQVGCPPDANRNDLCVATITLYANGTYSQALGGNAAAFDSGGRSWYTPNFGTAILPVSQGTTASAGCFQDGNNEVSAPFGFSFVPLGNPQGQALVEHVSPDEPQLPCFQSAVVDDDR